MVDRTRPGRGWGLMVGLLLLSGAGAGRAEDGAAEAPRASLPPRPAPAPRAVQWPAPPAPVAGGIHVSLHQADKGAALRLDGAPPPEAWDGQLRPGHHVELEGEGARLLLVWRLPEVGYTYHQLVEAPCRVAVGEDGRPQVEGLGWGRLFRTLAEVTAPFSLQWESVNTGFESTEVAVVDRRGQNTLLVLEGVVRVADTRRVEAGSRTAMVADTTRIRPARAGDLAAAVEEGTTAELALTAGGAPCPRDAASATFGAPLTTDVCFASPEARAETLRQARAAALVEGDPAAFSALADVYLSAGLYPEAAGTYRLALASFPAETARLLRERGNALWAAGDAVHAREAFRQATLAEPSDAGAWAGLAFTAGHLGDPAEAGAALERATTLAPTNAPLLRLLGEHHLAQGDAAAAARALQAALDAGLPADDTFLATLEESLRRSGAPQEALRVGQERVKLHPDSSRAWFDLAQGLLDAGRDAEALRAFERAYALDRQATPAE